MRCTPPVSVQQRRGRRRRGFSALPARFASALVAVVWCSSLLAHAASGRALEFVADGSQPAASGAAAGVSTPSPSPHGAVSPLARLRPSGNSNAPVRAPPAPPGAGPRYPDAARQLADVLAALPGPEVVLFEVESHNKARTPARSCAAAHNAPPKHVPDQLASRAPPPANCVRAVLVHGRGTLSLCAPSGHGAAVHRVRCD